MNHGVLDGVGAALGVSTGGITVGRDTGAGISRLAGSATIGTGCAGEVIVTPQWGQGAEVGGKS